jgi:hypothetical protein
MSLSVSPGETNAGKQPVQRAALMPCDILAHILVHKCNACEKPISDQRDDTALSVGMGMFRYHLCKRCAAPLLRVLKGYELATSKATLPYPFSLNLCANEADKSYAARYGCCQTSAGPKIHKITLVGFAAFIVGGGALSALSTPAAAAASFSQVKQACDNMNKQNSGSCTMKSYSPKLLAGFAQ